MKNTIFAILLLFVYCAQAQVPGQTQIALGDPVSRALQSRLLRLDDSIIETEALRKFYSLRNFQPLWFREGVVTDTTKQVTEIFTNAGNFGLKPQDYLTPSILNFLTTPSSEKSLSFELAMADSYLRFMHHLVAGRIEPDLVDGDIFLTRRKFSDLEIKYSHDALLAGAPALEKYLNEFGSQHPQYLQLQQALVRFREIRAQKQWETLSAPKKDILPGESNPLIARMKKRFQQLGYQINDTSPLFDAEFGATLKQYCSDNLIPCPTSIRVSPRSNSIWRSLNVKLDDRIKQLEVSLERYRWLARNLEPRHVFVNIAFTELRLYDNNQLVMMMKTVNGRPHKRTPILKDQIRFVELNPTWSVPSSIATKAKLNVIKKEADFFEKNNFILLDPKTKEPIQHQQIDWLSINKTNFNFLLRQNAGADNTLGVVKFPMTNPYAIYLHDTNERELFAENYRQISSGCVRLEKPMEFAAYLLKDQTGNSLDELKAQTSLVSANFEAEKKINLTEPIPVYLFYATAMVNEAGVVRFVSDYYGQDQKIFSLLNSMTKTAPAITETQEPTGSLKVRGEPGPSQIHRKVFATRCVGLNSNSCGPIIEFDLNQAKTLPVGRYMVGFENSIHLGWVTINAQQETNIDLIQIPMPVIKGVTNFRVSRDLTQESEKNKIYFQSYYLGKSLFPQTTYSFGDYYIAGAGQIDYTSRLADNTCAVIKKYKDTPDEARDLCMWLQYASVMEDHTQFFEISRTGIVTQKWMTFPSDIFQIKHKRFLVGAPLNAGEFVSVFPGNYQIIPEGRRAIPVSVGTISNDY